MQIVSTSISYIYNMATSQENVEDLEDGEIESEEEGEEVPLHNKDDEKREEVVPKTEEKMLQDKSESQDFYYSKSGKKKKSKSNKGEQKFKEKNKKSRKYSSPTQEDFAGHIEKAIRMAMNNLDGEEYPTNNDTDERRKHKKRKKYDGKDSSSKKRKKQEFSDEMDENEMMCVRGASPVQKTAPDDDYPEDDRDSYASDSSHESHNHQQRQQRHKPQQRERNSNKNSNKNERRRGTHPMQDPDGVCLYFMQGKCHKGEECVYSHDAQPPRKMELCKDVDMRFQSRPLPVVDVAEKTNLTQDTHSTKDMIDIDQYTKDALKFASKDKENIDISNDTLDDEKSIAPNESKDVDHRVVPFSDDGPRIIQTIQDNRVKKECDTDIRFLQPEPFFKNPEKRHRRSTTDDEDNNLLIDEKWYSSDEEKSNKKKSPLSSPSTPTPHVIEPSAVLSRIGDLSKIDISEEVTKLLNTMKNNLHEPKVDKSPTGTESPKSRDPRARRSPDNKQVDTNSKVTNKRPRISIYECVDGEPTDGRRRSDVDLRKPDFSIPSFGDTDLRPSTSGDIDLRLGLPFKAIPNYTPASEINASINSHPHIPYKVVPIYIPRPDYTDIRNSTAKSQALVDPRLRKVFRLSIEESNSDNEKPTKPAAIAPRIDPRRKQVDTGIQEQKTNSLDLQNVLQNSNWYKDLSSTQKIFVNQHLAPVTQMIKQFQQEKVPGKKFDLSTIQSNGLVCSIFTNLEISLGENGEFSYLPKPKEALLKTPVNVSQNLNMFNMNNNMNVPPGLMDGNNMNMINVPPGGMAGMNNMNNMNLGNIHGFNPPLSDPRGGPGPTPGLLGIAPNIPHNFNTNNFGGPNHYGNMPFNGPGPGNDFNFMDDQNYPRFPNRGGHRGRGNDRWNRGGAGRGGHRERKNFNDRGNWKNDRN